MKKKVVIIIIAVIIIALGVFEYKELKTDVQAPNEVEQNLIEEQNKIDENIAQDSQENVQVATNEYDNISENNISNEVSNNNISKETTITKTLAPSGFAGSSLLKVVLYSDGNVYLIHYDGQEYEESNITKKELIAKNATSIREEIENEEFSAIVVKSKDIVCRDYNWITFE